MNKKGLKKRLGEEGQSTIEFLFAMTLALGILFSFFKIAIIYTNGYLVHYVVFQSSRAYMVAEKSSNTESGSDGLAEQNANEVFESYNLPGIINNFSSDLTIEDPESHRGPSTNLYIGARVLYQEQMLIPMTSAKIELNMLSESYLGKEPTRAECFFQVCRAMQDIGSANCEIHSVVDDNGC